MKQILLLVCVFFFKIIGAQNLVPNGSFEVTMGEPTCTWVNIPQQLNLDGWYVPTRTTPDIYASFVEPICVNYCGSGNGFKQYPRTGANMVGLFTFGRTGQGVWHEYIGCELIYGMVKGKKYRLEMWILKKSTSPLASNNIGMYLSTTKVTGPGYTPLNFEPQLNATEVIDNKDNNWYKLSVDYEAKGGERYLVLGNFYEMLKTKTNPGVSFTSLESDLLYQLNNRAYYLIDDVSIVPLDDEMAKQYRKNEERIRAFTDILFATNKADLSTIAVNQLTDLAQFLKENPKIVIILNGHTDARGGEEDNLELSENRSKSVKDFLIAKGINANRIMTYWFGKRKPIADNDTEEGRRLNRRVSIQLVRR